MKSSIEPTLNLKSIQPNPALKARIPFGIASWKESARAFTNQPEGFLPRDPEINQMFLNIWPVSENYVSLLNPVFLADLQTQAARNTKPDYLIRDGLVPLIWFFTNNPEPGQFKAILRIHADFEQFVPPAWRSQVELYDFISDHGAGYLPSAGRNASEIKQIILIGLIAPSGCSLDRLHADLERIVEFAGGHEQLKKIKVRAFLPIRDEGATILNGSSFSPHYILTLWRSLQVDIEFLELEGLKWMYFEHGTWVHEFNEGHLYKDSYLRTLALAKGGRFIPMANSPSTPTVEYSQVIPIYPHVSCGIRREFKKPFVDYLTEQWKPENAETSETFYRAMNSSANIKYPWAKWIPSWCKDFTVSGQEIASPAVTEPQLETSEVTEVASATPASTDWLQPEAPSQEVEVSH